MARLKPLRWLLAVVLPVVVGLAVIAGAYSETEIRLRLAEEDASERSSFKAVRGRLDESFDGVLDFAYLTCGFGGGELDLSKATIEDSPATLDVAAYMGGGQIRIPGTWRIRNETTAIAGEKYSRLPVSL